MNTLVYFDGNYRQEYRIGVDITTADVDRILANQKSFLRNAAERFCRVGLPVVWWIGA